MLNFLQPRLSTCCLLSLSLSLLSRLLPMKPLIPLLRTSSLHRTPGRHGQPSFFSKRHHCFHSLPFNSLYLSLSHIQFLLLGLTRLKEQEPAHLSCLQLEVGPQKSSSPSSASNFSLCLLCFAGRLGNKSYVLCPPSVSLSVLYLSVTLSAAGLQVAGG